MKISPLMGITTAISLAALFLMSPYYLESRGMWYVDDDYDYFAHSSAMVFGQYPSYKKEFFTILKEGPQSPIGPGILATPFVFVFSLWDRAAGSTITEARTSDNITGSWSQFAFQVASIFYFTLACFFLFWGLSRFVAPLQASCAVILMMVCQGLPLYVYRRPFFSHCSEVFVQCVLMYLFLVYTAQRLRPGDEKKGARKRSPWLLTGVFALSGLLYLTRPNDIAFALVWPFLVMDYSKGISRVFRQAFLGLILFAGEVLVFKIWPEAVNHIHPYDWAHEFLATPMTWALYIQRIIHILIGIDWGLVYTAPFLIISFWGISSLKGPVFKRFVWLLVPIAINFYVILIWGSQGGWYGYRYFIVSSIPVMALPLAFILEWISKKIHAWAIPLITLLSFVPVLPMVAFERCTYFNLQLYPVDFNRTDWTNPDLLANVWGALVHAPGMLCFLISHGFMSLYFAITGEYPPLSGTTWSRVFIILILPWLMWCLASGKISNLICIFRRKIIK